MSTIHIVPKAAGQTTKVSRAEHMKPTWPGSSDKPAVADREMVHAWSIGVTEAGRLAQPSEQHETCPPEVYIG